MGGYGLEPLRCPSCVRRHSEFSVRKSAIPDFIQFFEAVECCHHAPGMTLVASDAQRPRPRRTYDHRLREHVVRCGPMAVAKHVHIPRSTVSTWRRRGLRPVVTTEMFDNKQDALDSSARWEKRARVLAAVVRLLLALLRASGFTLDGIRLPEGKAKAGILRAITSAETLLPLTTILHITGLEPGRYHAWRRAEKACELTDRSSCPRTSPGQLTGNEVAAVKEMVLAPEYRHMPLGTLARYAQRIGKVFASATTPNASTLKKSQAYSVSQCIFTNCFHVRFFSRSGAGSMPASARMLATVVRPISIFSPVRRASRIFV